MSKLNHDSEGQLITLYNKWIVSPKEYDQEMSETVDRIIHSTLNRQSLEPIYRKIEERTDLIQDLRFLCFKKLRNIQNPTNKRIFNFLRISISLALKDKARKVGKRLDREPIECDALKERAKVMPSIFYFNDPMLEKVATFLSEGESKRNICTILKISRSKLKQEIEKLKVMYNG